MLEYLILWLSHQPSGRPLPMLTLWLQQSQILNVVGHFELENEWEISV